MASFEVAGPRHRPDALQVWRAANTARDKPPSPARIERVAEKLHDAAVCLVVGVEGEQVIAMALAEPARLQNGGGAIQPGVGHISMVFVAPGRWGQGIGALLLDALHREMWSRGWATSSLWTGSGNARARQLYEGRGYLVTGDVKHHAGEEILRYELPLAGQV